MKSPARPDSPKTRETGFDFEHHLYLDIAASQFSANLLGLLPANDQEILAVLPEIHCLGKLREGGRVWDELQQKANDENRCASKPDTYRGG